MFAETRNIRGFTAVLYRATFKAPMHLPIQKGGKLFPLVASEPAQPQNNTRDEHSEVAVVSERHPETVK